MPQATFYTHVADAAAFVCRLSARAVAGGGRVLVWAEYETEIERIDADLWRIPPEGFLPHEIWRPGGAYPAETDLVLACGAELPELPEGTTVLNVSEQFWCDAPAVPGRVLEIVGTGLEELAAARDRFRAYREKGFAVEHHNMQDKA